MSSSVFVETPRSAGVSGNSGGDPTSINENDCNSQLLGNADSNLVVVYGKNGINVDRKGLENLIDEKTLTSISVIRITSPTPSMEDEEAEEIRKEAEQQALENEESNSDEEDEDDEEENSDSDAEEKTPKATKTLAKIKRPEIMGLTVEEFYPPNEAKELAKEILKYAGVTPLKCNVDYEFQRYVIKNDHCYTPFVSPSQTDEAKPTADDEAKQTTVTNMRKLPITTTTTVKQYLNKRKQNIEERKITGKEKSTPSSSDSSPNDNAKNDPDSQPDDEEAAADEDAANDEDDGSDFVSEESEESAETDNDRDSDSDFDVNNRHGKKRKNPVARRKKKEKQRARNLAIQKAALSNSKRRPQSQDHITYDEETKVVAPIKATKQQSQDVRKSVGGSTNKTIAKKQMQDDVPAAEPPQIAPPPVQPVKQLINIQSVEIVKPANKIDPAVMRSPYQMKPVAVVPLPPLVPITPTPVQPTTTQQQEQQNVKQIVINKVIGSPKGVFTDLSTLLTRNDNSMPNLRVAEINPPPPPEKQTVTKGFMPLGIETAAKNQLPAQISIQTHQSSSEIAAENDKQLDLIDSIVKDELDRSAGGLEPTGKQTLKENSIPDLVKMLESTEKAVLENNKIVSSTFTTSSVEAIDIANAPLLENADDDDVIPEDLLQHVVELMEDKSLQEAVEMQVLQHQEEQKRELEKQLEQINTIIMPPQSQTVILPAPAPMQRQQQQQQHAPQVVISTTATTTPLKQPKSIIEASISNSTTPTSSRDTTPTPTLNRSSNATYLRKEPIQIVRGNGRVITLPPIEAPTTRAKRRAQKQPDTSFNESESCDVSLQSADGSLFGDTSLHGPASETVFAATTPIPQQPKEKATKASAGKKKTAAAKSKMAAQAKLETKEAGESQEDEDEDDPNKLWCICRQPHNNRFMICCDKCEDWFHGTCVSITKAMGLEMEQKGIEWTCPKCIKKFDPTKKQRKITELFENKKTLVEPMPQLDVQKKYPNGPQTSSVQSKITDAFNKKTVVQFMPKLEDNLKLSRGGMPLNQQQQIIQNNTITLQEVTGENKQMIDLKKLQPGQFYTLTPSRTIPAVGAAAKKAQAMKQTPDNVQNRSLKATPPVENSSPASASAVVGNLTTKRVIVMPSTPPVSTIQTASPSPKAVGRGAAMVKASVMNQQQLKLGKVPTAAEKKQFALSKLQQQNSTDSLEQSSSSSPAGQNKSFSGQKQQPAVVVELLTCIVCKKQARANSIYCSDDCIRKHAQNALNAVKVPEPVTPTPLIKLGPDEKKKKSKGLFEDLLSMADRKPKVERVSVLERRTGKLLTGSNAPTTLNLKKWLQDNPTFEVVQPGSAHALEIEKSKQKSRLNVQSPTNTNTFTPLKADGPIVTSVITLTPPAMASPQPVFLKNVKQQQDANKLNTNKPSSSSNVQQQQQRGGAVKQQQQHHQQLQIKTDKSDKDKSSQPSPSPLPSPSQKVLKKQSSVNDKDSAISPPAVRESSEPVRVNVRRTLKEQLLIRIKEVSDEKKLSEEQVEEFVKATEHEMYRLFNKDIGTKYKAKYRSLMFNIKDRKNETLLLKICSKLIEPRQLVRMSPEELASQELAQWRENEAKHQLEMIKKSELDMLSCTKTYVLKTHKGEEVIEGKAADRVDLDITIPVEDVVAVLNNSIVSSTSEIEASLTSPRKDAPTLHHELEQENATSSVVPPAVASVTSSEKKKEKERDREKRHKSKDRHREKNRKRSRSRERHHKSSSRKDERREKDERAVPATTTKKDEPSESPAAKMAKIAAPPTKQVEPQPQVPPPKTTIKPAVKKIAKPTPPPPPAVAPIESFNLIDQILESTKTVEQAANLQKDKQPPATPQPLPKVDSTPVEDLPAKLKTPPSPSATESDQEPSSTVSISTPPEDPYFRYSSDVDASMWTGLINMIDVASFQVSLQTVSGNTYLLSKDLPDELDIVGRISPDTVWDYIGKIKRSPNKEVVIIRLVPSGESETNAYTILYKYLDKRKRLGVIKTTSSNIKDFYIMPLGVGQQMPSVLQASENFDFYDDVMRPDMLLGIVIRIMGKRHSNASMRRKKESTVISNRSVKSVMESDGTTFTPPGSPNLKNTDSHRSMPATASSRSAIRKEKKSTDDEEIDIDAIIKAPITSKKTLHAQSSVVNEKDDADEPYSPGGGSSDDDVPPTKIPARDDDLKRKMDEINRQIEAQKMEIAGLLSHDQSSSLANISIPSNLHQILASIQSKPEPPSQAHQSTAGKVPTMVPPPPMIGSLSHHSHDEEYVPEPTIAHTNISRDPKTSRLAQLSEAELLSMVPDNIDLASSNTSSHRNTSGLEPPPEKRARWSEPPPPGMESEFN